MDPNQYNFQKSMWNLMQNYQDSNSQNSQFLTLPTNPNMFYRPQMDTQGVEFPHPNLATRLQRRANIREYMGSLWT
jgi:hypothetical protein